MSNETVIVGDLKAGSEEAYTWLVREFRRPVFRVVERIVDGRADAADATQEVFLKIFRGIRHFHGDSSLKTWIYRIATREASNQVRWWSRHKALETSLEPLNSANDDMRFITAIQHRMADGRDSPLDSIVLAETRERVQRELSGIPEPFRTAVILRDVEGKSYREIARITGAPIGSVSSRLAHGRRVLRDRVFPTLALSVEGDQDSQRCSVSPNS